METGYSEIQLDALRELANIGSGTAATSLSQLLGRAIDVSVPKAYAVPLAEAVEAVGPPETTVTAVVLPFAGGVDGIVLLLFLPDDSEVLCGLLGVDPRGELAASALGEIANILGSSYIGALGTMTGIELEPRLPEVAADMLGAVVSTVLAAGAQTSDTVLMLDSDLTVEDVDCSLSFMLVPSHNGVDELLARLGLAG